MMMSQIIDKYHHYLIPIISKGFQNENRPITNHILREIKCGVMSFFDLKQRKRAEGGIEPLRR